MRKLHRLNFNKLNSIFTKSFFSRSCISKFDRVCLMKETKCRKTHITKLASYFFIPKHNQATFGMLHTCKRIAKTCP